MSVRNRRRLLGALACGLLVTAGAVPARAGSATVEALPGSCKLQPTKVLNPGCVPSAVDGVTGYDYTYPDLVPNVTTVYVSHVYLGYNPDTGQFIWGPPQLNFDTVAQNLGQVAVDIQSDDVTNQVNPPASQCVAWTALVCRERKPVGGFEIHPGHGHIHFNDFAKYELRKVLPDGTPDYSAAGLVVLSDKVSFCLLDLMKVRDDANPVGTYTMCGAVREGISAGWADIYGAELEGQQFLLDGVSDGRYAIVIAMNYSGNLFESDYTNNQVAVIVDLVTGDTPSATIVDRLYS